MSEYEESDKNLFTFIWKIENFRMNGRRKGQYLRSPTFEVQSFFNTKWCLKLYPKGIEGVSIDKMICSLCRRRGFSELSEIVMQYYLCSSCNDIPKPDIKNSFCGKFKRGDGKRHCINIMGKKAESSVNSIFVICNMWMDTKMNCSEGESSWIKSFLDSILLTSPSTDEISSSFADDIKEVKNKICHFPNRVFVRSHFAVKRRTFSCSMHKIPKGVNLKRSFIVSTPDDTPTLIFTLYVEEKEEIEHILVDIRINEVDFDPVFCIFKMSLSDVSGKMQHSVEYERYLMPDNDLHFEIPCSHISQTKLNQASKHISRFYCDIVISDEDMLSTIEHVLFDQECFPDDEVKSSECYRSLHDDMSGLFEDGRFCDVTLRLRGKNFKAHKMVLCARSPVFNAMFTNEMVEKESNEITIDDVDADTLHRMLMFMYSDSLEDLNFEASLKLYEAADKYQLKSLKEKCGTFIKSHLTVENVCLTFYIGDSHHDEKVKTCAIEFILLHVREVLLSEEWKMFMKENVGLANEILQEICVDVLCIKIR